MDRLAESDWRLFAVVRLRALCDALGVDDPQYRQEASFTAAQWRRRLREHAQFVAIVDERPVGLIGAQQESTQRVYLYSLWLDPAARGLGLARALVGAALAWARTRQAHTVTLRVATDNAVARGVYEGMGFAVAVGDTAAPPGELTMTRSV
ncbi:MAG: GNAT family N-acetyltransferase [Actinobacteria bacterium]|nr:GNAT family N-acetyltransferase [Actinomycetota bacterium]